MRTWWNAPARCRIELAQEIKRKVIEMGFYACNFPEEVGGGGLGHLDFTLVERELGRGSMALTHFFGRPQNILMACEGEQKEKYLFRRSGASGWTRWP
jgi:acyl-CoA dehydrogenase